MRVAMRLIDDPDQLVKLGQKVCAIEADACPEAGGRLAYSDRLDAAMPLGKRAIESAHGQINLSNNMSWYVSALQERGRAAEGMRVARRMAAVYSEAGLRTLGKAYERTGQFTEAADVFRQITDRYDKNDQEDDFYIRHAQRHGAAPFDLATNAALARVFPKGLRKITIEQSSQATLPLSLNLTRVMTGRLREIGLTHRDSFLAVDGFVVETPRQYELVQTFTDDPKAVFLVKHEKGAIEEIRATIYRAHYDVVARGPASDPLTWVLGTSRDLSKWTERVQLHYRLLRRA